jgi:hypothetical protein
MAVGILISMPGFTQEQYEQVSAELWGQHPMRPDQAPEGMIIHTAGPMPDGWYVYDVWDSAEQFQRFGEERVGPAMQAALGGEAAPPQPQIYDIHTYSLGS